MDILIIVGGGQDAADGIHFRMTVGTQHRMKISDTRHRKLSPGGQLPLYQEATSFPTIPLQRHTYCLL